MAGKQAKILKEAQQRAALRQTRYGRYACRDQVMVLLSIKAGLRAGEIAALTWPMVLTSDGMVARQIALEDRAAKKGSGRMIPMHPELRRQLIRLVKQSDSENEFVIRSERGGRMRARSIVNWFKVLYAALGLEGCSSHSGRRTFITRAAKLVTRAGGSLRDVQQLAGHRSLLQTQVYIEGDTAVKRRLVAMI